ncbi:MAG: aminotransferase class I/II-fold pyridoxal phosphate-dependent enzyme, partial [Rubrivivax sp.]
VVPEALAPHAEKLAMNLYICPSALAQHAALACFDAETIALCEQRRGELQRRRDRVLAGLARVGLPVPVEPDGAFYAWADCSGHASSSWTLCHELLERAHLVLTPGRDFGPAQAERFLRLSFAGGAQGLDEAIDRLARALDSGRPAA